MFIRLSVKRKKPPQYPQEINTRAESKNMEMVSGSRCACVHSSYIPDVASEHPASASPPRGWALWRISPLSNLKDNC